ncbi:hypothetical protein ACH5RR_013830 [Cinchona calisaya]|uniref:NB-ARC domain-containing protein n=1 Tax=Cinchona calisaya TaxID=153742 RepID=A0ABD3A2K8_9GENT
MEAFMIIIDDVWTPFHVTRIGIPIGVHGSKLIVISRSLEVCHHVGCQKEIKVKPLCENEAWTLFLDKLHPPVELPSDVKEIAMSMVKRCGGLLLGIMALAGRMKGVNDIHEWREASKELDGSFVRQNVKAFDIFNLSYNYLTDYRLKHCFLYCSFYSKNYKIPRNELIRMFILEGLMDKIKSRLLLFDQGHVILNRLESMCLLESDTGVDVGNHRQTECVKMHCLIRDMALKRIKLDFNYMVKSGIGLEHTPDENEWKVDLENVSLMHNNISSIPVGTSPNCPKLSSMTLASNPLRLILDSFFFQLKALKVLDLSRNYELEVLPNSISQMRNLTALLLFDCCRLSFVPLLGKLTALKELDLYHTAIKNVPEGMERLVNLKCLNMYSTGLRMIPDEEFQGGLDNVGTFCHLFRYRQSHEGPIFYTIEVSPNLSLLWFLSPGPCQISTKKVTLSSIELGRKSAIVLPEDIQQLTIIKCHGLGTCLTTAFSLFNIQGRGLTDCVIDNCFEIECIIKMSSLDDQLVGESNFSLWAPLESLERLSLLSLPNFIRFFDWELEVVATPIPYSIFCHLKSITISSCHRMTTSFTPCLLQHLQNLELVEVMRCDQLEEIITDEGGKVGLSPSISDQHSHISFNFPRLKKLTLQHLPKLRSICKGNIICKSIEKIRIIGCQNLTRIPLFVSAIDGPPNPLPALRAIEILKEELQCTGAVVSRKCLKRMVKVLCVSPELEMKLSISIILDFLAYASEFFNSPSKVQRPSKQCPLEK